MVEEKYCNLFEMTKRKLKAGLRESPWVSL